MAYGDSLGVTLPTVLVTPGATAAGMINAAIQACVDRLESQVTVAGLDINADLSVMSGATSFGLVDVHRVSFYDQTVALNAVTYPQSLYAVGSSLYFNDDAGNQVRIVTSGAIDLSSIGGITGAGYGVSGVEVNWDGTNYNFKDGSGADDYAAIAVDDVLLRDGSGNAIRLAAPALAADYTMTLPDAVPAGNSVMVMRNSGAVAHDVLPDSFAITTNGHITVSGTGRYKHGELVRNVSPFGMTVSSGVGYTYAAGEYGLVATGAGDGNVPVNLDVGERLIRVTVRVQADNVNKWDAELFRVGPSGTATSLATDSSVTGSGTTPDILTLEPVSPETVASGDTYFVRMNASVGDTDLLIHGAAITYDRV